MNTRKLNISKVVCKGLLILILLCSLAPTINAISQNSTSDGIVYAANSNSNSASCEEQTKGTNLDKDTQKLFSQVANGIIILEKAIFAINIPLIWLIGKLISNDWVYLDGNVYTVLHTLWLLIRNVVNIIFVVILIFIAFMTVVGGGSEKSNFAIKSMLPRFIIALVVVNFSLLFCRVILDGANILTTFSFSLPNTVGEKLFDDVNLPEANKDLWCYPDETASGGNKCAWDTMIIAFGNEAEQRCKDIKADQDNFFGAGFAIGWADKAADGHTVAKPSTDLFDSRNAMFAYAYNTLHLGGVMNVFKENQAAGTGGSGANEVQGITLTMIIAIIFAGFLLLLNVAMFLAFAIRTVLIWVSMIFSPLLALEILWPDKTKGITSKLGMKEGGFLKGFITLAIMPAVAGFILSLGYIMYKVFTSFDLAKGSIIKLWPITIEVYGSPLPTFGNIQQMILALMMMVFVWGAIMATLRSNTIVEKGAAKIDDFGKSMAKLAGKGLSLIPIIPTGKGTTSAAALSKAVSYTGSQFDTMAAGQVKELGKQWNLPWLSGAVKMSDDDKKFLKDVSERVENKSTTPEDQKRIASLFNGYKDPDRKDHLQPIVSALGSKLDLSSASSQEVADLLKKNFNALQDIKASDVPEHASDTSGPESVSATPKAKSETEVKVTVNSKKVTVGNTVVPTLTAAQINAYQVAIKQNKTGHDLDIAKTPVRSALEDAGINGDALTKAMQEIENMDAREIAKMS